MSLEWYMTAGVKISFVKDQLIDHEMRRSVDDF